MSVLDDYTGQFFVRDGVLDVTTGYNVRYSVASVTDCTVNIDHDTGVYRVSDVDEDNANAIFVAKYNGLSIYNTFQITKVRTATQGSGPRIVLDTNNYDFSYDEANHPATESATLTVAKFNTSASTLWRIKKIDGVLIAEGSASDLLTGGYITSTANPNQIVINQDKFDALIVANTTNAIVIEVQVIEGSLTLVDRLSLFQLIQKNKVTWDNISDPTGAKAQLIQQTYDAQLISNAINRAIDDVRSKNIQTASSLHVNITRVERETKDEFTLVETVTNTLSLELDGVSTALTTEQTVRAGADAAMATNITNLTSTVSGVSSALTTESTTRANADSAIAFQILDLTSDIGDVSADLTTEQSTRATADSALSSSLSSLSATVGTISADLITEATTRATADGALTSLYNSLNSSLGTTNANLTTEQTTRASADTALGASITTINATVNNVNGTGLNLNAWANASTTAQASEASTRASNDVALQSDYNGKIGTINSTLSTQVSKMGVVENQYVLSLNAGGNAVTGLILANNSAGLSIFGVQADKFYILNSSGSGNAPFYTSGGVSYLDNAVIANASIGSAKIGSAAIQTGHINNLAVDTLQIANNAVTIPASVYSAGGVTSVANTYVDLQTYTYTSSGGPVFVFANAIQGPPGSYASGWDYQIVRNGNVIYNTKVNTLIGSNGGLPVALSVTDTPGAGSVTYVLQYRATTATQSASQRSMLFLEVKR